MVLLQEIRKPINIVLSLLPQVGRGHNVPEDFDRLMLDVEFDAAQQVRRFVL